MTPQSPANAEFKGRTPLIGVSLIAGEPAEASPQAAHRSVCPGSGEAFGPVFTPATAADADHACSAAWAAFHELDGHSSGERADYLEAVANRIVEVGQALIDIAEEETGFTPVRLTAERERAVATLRMFAASIRRGDCAQAIIDTAEPARRPVPRPDVRRINRPLGPVALFGPGSSPIASGVVGADAASAIAAGCPIIVKGHPAHPATGEILAVAAMQAAAAVGLPTGIFSYLVGDWAGEVALGATLARHPCVRAVGFTGSAAAGSMLEQTISTRGDRAPFLALMASSNPVFILPGADEAEVAEIGSRLASTVVAGAGQTCLRPSIVFLVRSGEAEVALRTMAEAVSVAGLLTLMHGRAAHRFAAGVRSLLSARAAEIRGGECPHEVRIRADGTSGTPFRAMPVLLRTTFAAFRADERMHAELFGPVLLAVICDDELQMLDAASMIQGALAASIWSGLEGAAAARRLQTVLEQRVGRLLFNALPGWLEPSAAMMHGGPNPVGTRPDLTAAGPFATVRWTRPVCYQNAPEAFLPAELRTPNPRRVRRLYDGVWTNGPGRPASQAQDNAA